MIPEKLWGDLKTGFFHLNTAIRYYHLIHQAYSVLAFTSYSSTQLMMARLAIPKVKEDTGLCPCYAISLQFVAQYL